MPSKYVRFDDFAVNVEHTGATTLPDRPPALSRGAFLVFVHGEGGSAPLWSRQLAELGAEHSPVAIDLPGHGRSAGLDGPESVGAGAEVLLRVRDAWNAPPAVIVGHGLGGQVALALAARRPERVRAVVTIGTAVRSPLAPELVEQLRQVVRGRIGQQFDTPFFSGTPDFAVMRGFWGEMVKTDPRVRLQDVVAYANSDLGGMLGDVRRPVLVVQGAEDRMCPPACAEELAAAIPGARVQSIAGAGHVAHLEKPGEVNAAIAAFAAGLRPVAGVA